MAGGPTHGDPPTDSCDAVRMLHRIGISQRPIERAFKPHIAQTNGVPTCPDCSSETIAAVETIIGFVDITPNRRRPRRRDMMACDKVLEYPVEERHVGDRLS